MLALQLACPSCKTVLRVGEESQGKLVRCPKCQTVLKIPAPAALPAAPKPPVPPPPAQKSAAAVKPAATRRPAVPRPTAPPPPADDLIFDDAPPPRRPAPKPKGFPLGLALAGCGALAVLLLGGAALIALFVLPALLGPSKTPPVANSTPNASAGPGATSNPTSPDGNKPDAKTSPPAPTPADARQPLLGKWENTDEQDKGTLEFFGDGSVAVGTAGAPDAKGSYKLVGDGVMEVELPLPGGQTVTQKLKFLATGDELATTDEAGKVDHFKRSTTAPSNPPAENVPAGWTSYVSKDGGYRMLVPQGPPPRESDEKGTGPYQDVTLHVARFDGVNGDSAIVAADADLAADAVKGGADAVLDGDKSGILLLPLGAEPGPRIKVTVDGQPGRDFDLKLPSGLPARAWVVLAGDRMVQVMVMGGLAKNAAGQDLQTLFGSLRLNDAAAQPEPPPLADVRELGVNWIRDNNALGPTHKLVADAEKRLNDQVGFDDGFLATLGARLTKSGKPTMLVGWGSAIFPLELTPEQGKQANIQDAELGVTSVPGGDDLGPAPPFGELSALRIDHADALDAAARVTGSVQFHRIRPDADEYFSLRLTMFAPRTKVTVYQHLGAGAPPKGDGPLTLDFPPLKDDKMPLSGPVPVLVELVAYLDADRQGPPFVVSNAAATLVEPAADKSK